MLSLSIRLDLSSGLFPSALPPPLPPLLYAFLIRSTAISRAWRIITDRKGFDKVLLRN